MELIIVVIVAALLAGLVKSNQRSDVVEKPKPKYRPNDRNRRTSSSSKTRKPRPTTNSGCTPAGYGVITGVPYVTDGDSLIIKKTEIRLFGVDAPEMNHPFGKKAKWAMFGLCKGQAVRAEIVDIDAHGRSVAKCYLPDGRDLSAEIVKLGLAIDWPKFSDGKYSQLEVPNARKKMWLADARQKGRMHVWMKYDESRKTKAS